MSNAENENTTTTEQVWERIAWDTLPGEMGEMRAWFDRWREVHERGVRADQIAKTLTAVHEAGVGGLRERNGDSIPNRQAFAAGVEVAKTAIRAQVEG